MNGVQPAPRGGFVQVKETIEQLLIAFILAFTFRAFVVEAFVIPTGSMAETLYGAHRDYTCSSCGYPYAVGAGTRSLHERVCPNCNWVDSLRRSGPPNAGDRIVVLKWLYALGGRFGPKRWDVTVFKAPFDGKTNYIKRLVGLPNEVIELIDGDLYVADTSQIPQRIRDILLDETQQLTPEDRAALDAELRIARKTDLAQQALWTTVYNADYPAAPRETRPAWHGVVHNGQAPTHWELSDRRILFDGLQAEPEFLQLTHEDFKDHYGYNGGAGRRVVSDLRIHCTAIRRAGEGALHLVLSKRDELYVAQLYPNGSGKVLHKNLAGPLPARQLGLWRHRPWRVGVPVEIEFWNVDKRLTVLVDGQKVWHSKRGEFADTAFAAKQQAPEARPPIVRIGAGRLQIELRHVAVERDVYYRDEEQIHPRNKGGQPQASPLWAKPGWATRNHPMLLRADEYFVLGDNSPLSKDSRLWWRTGGHLENRPGAYRLGTVPADQMVGKAFFVYWPSWHSLLGDGLRLIPNVGQMRWVR